MTVFAISFSSEKSCLFGSFLSRLIASIFGHTALKVEGSSIWAQFCAQSKVGLSELSPTLGAARTPHFWGLLNFKESEIGRRNFALTLTLRSIHFWIHLTIRLSFEPNDLKNEGIKIILPFSKRSSEIPLNFSFNMINIFARKFPK